MNRRRRTATICGLVAPVIAVGAILLATLVASPETFTWRGRALSDMGRPGAETFWLFDGGLIVGGLVGAPFVWRVWIEASGPLQRAGAVSLAVAIVGTISVGVFFLEHTEYYVSTDLHGPAALTAFGFGPAAALLYGAGSLRGGERRWGLLSVGVGVAPVAQWVVWIGYARTIAADPWAWFAVPEALAAALFGGWVVLLARCFRRADAPGPTRMEAGKSTRYPSRGRTTLNT
ncbi:DUF998 domain-containing protein [Halovivax sp.]|uniref:DUF998 domain-containing protein n=1 Tax=Halovivax sp. TaxID=1935978 RepID=UPI0025BAD21F|nr:DUF998 domain-containing protein [Halovivax sp.]